LMHQGEEVEHRTEHAVCLDPHAESLFCAMLTSYQSILSHLPQHFDPSTTRLFVLIYAPRLTSLPARPTSSQRAPPSTLSSSYSAISTPAQTPSDEVPSNPLDVRLTSPIGNPQNRLFDALWTQALALVDRQSMIMPFTTPTGYIHILRHLSPSLVYLSDSPTLSGHQGDHVAQLKGWVGQTILVVGDDGHGGLADTEDEEEGAAPSHNDDKWWEGSNQIGLGKAVEVVDAAHVGEDWARRMGGAA